MDLTHKRRDARREGGQRKEFIRLPDVRRLRTILEVGFDPTLRTPERMQGEMKHLNVKFGLFIDDGINLIRIASMTENKVDLLFSSALNLLLIMTHHFCHPNLFPLKRDLTKMIRQLNNVKVSRLQKPQKYLFMNLSSSFSTAEASSIPSEAPTLSLYQYKICPFCCKTKSILSYLKVPFKAVEVNPLNKKEFKYISEVGETEEVRARAKRQHIT